VGVIFDPTGAPVLTFAYFADKLGDVDNYGATHPAVRAHAVLGRAMYDAVAADTNPDATFRQRVTPFNARDTA